VKGAIFTVQQALPLRGPEDFRGDDAASAHGRSVGDRRGGGLSCFVGQQLHDGAKSL
jgi:hypothetical protein